MFIKFCAACIFGMSLPLKGSFFLNELEPVLLPFVGLFDATINKVVEVVVP